MRKVTSENQLLKRQLRNTHEQNTIIGKSEEMGAVFRLVGKVTDFRDYIYAA